MKMRLLVALLAPLALSVGACTVEQTEEGEAPEIEGGELPEYDVDAADADVEWDTAQVRVPDVDIDARDDTVRTR